MIFLFTDYGLEGPYLGQVKSVLHQDAPGVRVIDLMADAPAHDPHSAAYLLAAMVPARTQGDVFLAVVDPGVGSDRAALVVEANGRWFVGPDNGLLAVVVKQAELAEVSETQWRPKNLSNSFHGRDLFAPIAARLAKEESPPGPLKPRETITGANWAADLPRIVYLDRFGNAMTGLRAKEIPDKAELQVGGRNLSKSRTFSDVAQGEAFWYENANGLVEVAVNQGRADEVLRLGIGDPVAVIMPSQRGLTWN